jgi:pyruvate,water dikinase
MSLLDVFRKKDACELVLNVEGKVVERYNHFRSFLYLNRDALNLIAELEQVYYSGIPFSMGGVRARVEELIQTTRSLVQTLSTIARGKYANLLDACDEINGQILQAFNPEPTASVGDLVLPFEALKPDMAKAGGGKATNLAIIRNLLSIPIPEGFVITAHAFERFLEESGLAEPVDEMLAMISTELTEEMEARCRAIQELVLNAEVPAATADEIFRAYAALEARTRTDVHIAMRSSAVGEDTEASFAGQYITVLNVTKENLLDAYKAVLASKYSPRAILYRLNYGLDDRDTPMGVAGLVMVDSKASGVLYTVDPANPDSSLLKISSIWGLGEHLVSGEASPDVFYVDKATGEIKRRDVSRKERRLVNLESGGTLLEKVPDDRQAQPSIDDQTVQTLARYGLDLEQHFRVPQDVEWALDENGSLSILQSRPLGILETTPQEVAERKVFLDHPVLLSAGKTASKGIASGVVVIADGKSLSSLPEDAILVAKAASPDYAAYVGKLKGIITDVGSVASHLASVVREFGVPAIFDAGNATSVLRDGQVITMAADTATVYSEFVPELAADIRPHKRHLFESPIHRRMRAVLDKISPLNLTDPKDPAFSPEGCKTIHDIIRFSHEQVMKEMFLLSEGPGGGVVSVKLTSNIPIELYCIDLGGGLKEMLTTCDTVTPHHLESIPMKALWSGFSHPGITWSGAVGVSFGNFMTLMASGATGGTPGGDSYAILSRDYLNLSAKFGYHYANVDAFCSEEADQNHIVLQFSGGAGSYAGRSLRISLLAAVLGRLGFTVTITGDLLEASAKGFDLKLMETTLDQLGRLLASSRLLDMAIPNLSEVDRMTEAFFEGDYDFLGQRQTSQLPGFYTAGQEWELIEENGRMLWLQDGSKWAPGIGSGMAKFMGRMIGAKYQEFMDNIRAYYYFPLAIAKDSLVSDAVLRVRTKSIGGNIDRAGGLAFGIINIGNYFVLRLNALEDNFMLFEFINNRRFTRASVPKEIETGRWHQITVEVSGDTIKGYLDGELLIEYTSERPLKGHVGIWTKADSVTYFEELIIEADGTDKGI